VGGGERNVDRNIDFLNPLTIDSIRREVHNSITFPTPRIGGWLYTSVNPVPVPAAVWLFGTALVGLVGFGKRKSREIV